MNDPPVDHRRDFKWLVTVFLFASLTIIFNIHLHVKKTISCIYNELASNKNLSIYLQNIKYYGQALLVQAIHLRL